MSLIIRSRNLQRLRRYWESRVWKSEEKLSAENKVRRRERERDRERERELVAGDNQRYSMQV